MDVAPLEQRLSHDLPDHPRLLWIADGPSAVTDRIASDPALEITWRQVRDAADGMVDGAPLKRELTGRRLLGVSRQFLKRMLYLGAAWRVTGEPRYADQARAEMLAVAAFPDFNPSHFLDVAEMTAGLAIGYDWFHDALDDETRATLRTAIIDKGLKASLADHWFITAENNWNQVCHGGLVLGALAVAEHEPQLAARIIARAVDNLPHAMKHYQPDGAYPEGPMYWEYGTSYNVLLIDALEQALGESFGLIDQPGFLNTADYYLHVTGPTGRFFNYADGGDRRPPSPAQAWLARRRGEPALARDDARLLQALGPIDPVNQSHRLLPLMLVWAPSFADLPEPALHSYLGRGRSDMAVHRDGWHGEAVWVGLKGGTPSANHGHMDVGQFVLDADGIRWSVDLGSQDYNGLESRGMNIWNSAQESDRWKVFRYNNHAHSTLTVNGQLQHARGFAPIIQHAAAREETPAHSVIDMSAVYPDQLAHARRGVMLLADGQVLVQDEVRSPRDADGATTIRWVMNAPGELEAADPGEAVLTADGQRLHLRLLGRDAPPTFTAWPLEPPNPWDAENPGLQRVGFEVTLQPGEQATWAVLLTPGSRADAATAPALQPLADWSPPLEK
ncbi:MAG: heparinase II/III family protein [Phycisphaeraceae bacterium]